MGGKGKRRMQEEEEPVKKKQVITEEQLMDKSHMDKTEFIPLLPSESLYSPFIYDEISEAASRKIVADLNYLLYIDFKNFWATVLYNPTFKTCLSSCLSYLHRRWMNLYTFSKESDTDFQDNEQHRQSYARVKDYPIFEFTQGLAEALLFILHRIVSFNVENRELSTLYKIGEEISRKFILDIPRLYELSEIYGESNPEIVRYIINEYSKTVPNFYQTLTGTILPIFFKRVEEVVRNLKIVTDREEYGINYNYTKHPTQQLSQGEEELKRKVSLLMELLGFNNIITNTIKYFPSDCMDHCYFNSQIQYLYENIFLELEVAYKTWNYQTQEAKLLNIINYIIKECINYFAAYFDRCEDIVVLRNKKVPTFEAYTLSLERIFRDYGKRITMSRKNQSRNLLMYKIIQKHFDLQKLVQNIYKEETERENGVFNMDYLTDFLITLDNVLKEEHISEDEPRQEQIEEETQAENLDNAGDLDEPAKEEGQKQTHLEGDAADKTKQEEIDLLSLQIMVPKRMRSEDYYSRLYADYNKKFYKGEYEDDYDDIADYNKRPLFYDEESSNSESESEVQKHLVSNTSNLQHVKELHNKHTVNRNAVRAQNAEKPKYSRVENVGSSSTPAREGANNGGNSGSGAKRFEQRGGQVEKEGEKGEVKEAKKTKYVQKPKQEIIEQQDYEGSADVKASDRGEKMETVPGEQIYRKDENPRLREDQQQPRGGQGYKKSNKSHNYQPKAVKNHDTSEKGRNSNKTRENEGGQKRYKQKN